MLKRPKKKCHKILLRWVHPEVKGQSKTRAFKMADNLEVKVQWQDEARKVKYPQSIPVSWFLTDGSPLI